MSDELKLFLVKAGVWLSGGAGLLVLAWVLLGAALVKPPSEVSVPAVQAPEVRKAPTARVKVPSVQVYAGDTKAKLKLPGEVTSNASEQVVAAIKTPGNDRPQTITTTINTDTGEFRSFVKTDPYPWFAVEARGEVRLSGGYKLDGATVKPIVRLGASYDVARIKALTAGAVASVDSDGDTFVGIGIAYRF